MSRLCPIYIHINKYKTKFVSKNFGTKNRVYDDKDK